MSPSSTHRENEPWDTESEVHSLRRLATVLSEAHERDRKRVARVLHDELQQLVVAAKMSVAIARSTPREETRVSQLDQADSLLSEVLSASRTLAMDLSPPVLSDSGLLVALRWLAGHLSETRGLDVRLELCTAAELRDETTRLLLFAAVRELLENVLQHSWMMRAVVTVMADEDELRVVVADEGRGFAPGEEMEAAGRSGHLGLFNMRQRLMLLGGWMEVESAPGSGTRVTLAAPLG